MVAGGDQTARARNSTRSNTRSIEASAVRAVRARHARLPLGLAFQPAPQRQGPLPSPRRCRRPHVLAGPFRPPSGSGSSTSRPVSVCPTPSAPTRGRTPLRTCRVGEKGATTLLPLATGTSHIRRNQEHLFFLSFLVFCVGWVLLYAGVRVLVQTSNL